MICQCDRHRASFSCHTLYKRMQLGYARNLEMSWPCMNDARGMCNGRYFSHRCTAATHELSTHMSTRHWVFKHMKVSVY